MEKVGSADIALWKAFNGPEIVELPPLTSSEQELLMNTTSVDVGFGKAVATEIGGSSTPTKKLKRQPMKKAEEAFTPETAALQAFKARTNIETQFDWLQRHFGDEASPITYPYWKRPVSGSLDTEKRNLDDLAGFKSTSSTLVTCSPPA